MADSIKRKISDLPICEEFKQLDTLIGLNKLGESVRINGSNIKSGEVYDIEFDLILSRNQSEYPFNIICLKGEELTNILSNCGRLNILFNYPYYNELFELQMISKLITEQLEESSTILDSLPMLESHIGSTIKYSPCLHINNINQFTIFILDKDCMKTMITSRSQSSPMSLGNDDTSFTNFMNNLVVLTDIDINGKLDEYELCIFMNDSFVDYGLPYKIIFEIIESYNEPFNENNKAYLIGSSTES